MQAALKESEIRWRLLRHTLSDKPLTTQRCFEFTFLFRLVAAPAPASAVAEVKSNGFDTQRQQQQQRQWRRSLKRKNHFGLWGKRIERLLVSVTYYYCETMHRDLVQSRQLEIAFCCCFYHHFKTSFAILQRHLKGNFAFLFSPLLWALPVGELKHENNTTTSLHRISKCVCRGRDHFSLKEKRNGK